MNTANAGQERVLAIDPCHRGVGFVILDRDGILADWGVCRVPNHRHNTTLASVTLLMERYKPSLLVVESTQAGQTRRGTRAKRLIRAVSREAEKRQIAVCPVSIRSVKAVFLRWHATKKEARASLLVKRFPVLALYRPPHRRPWTSEDTRMAIFDALSFAVTQAEMSNNAGAARFNNSNST